MKGWGGEGEELEGHVIFKSPSRLLVCWNVIMWASHRLNHQCDVIILISHEMLFVCKIIGYNLVEMINLEVFLYYKEIIRQYEIETQFEEGTFPVYFPGRLFGILMLRGQPMTMDTVAKRTMGKIVMAPRFYSQYVYL